MPSEVDLISYLFDKFVLGLDCELISRYLN